MIRISKESQYGLRAMVHIAKYSGKTKLCSVREISQKEGIPFDFLEKIIAKLEKADFIKGKKGLQGGYILAKKASKISAKDILAVLEGNTNLVECGLCDRSAKCVAKNAWHKLQTSLDKTLKSIKLSNLA